MTYKIVSPTSNTDYKNMNLREAVEKLKVLLVAWQSMKLDALENGRIEQADRLKKNIELTTIEVQS